MDNKKLLEKVIENRLKSSMDEKITSQERSRAFKEAMEAVGKNIEVEKFENNKKEQEENKQLEKEKLVAQTEAQKVNNKKDTILKYVEVAAVPVALFIMDAIVKRSYIKTVCNFEKDYTFTTTPGKSVGSIFRFKN